MIGCGGSTPPKSTTPESSSTSTSEATKPQEAAKTGDATPNIKPAPPVKIEESSAAAAVVKTLQLLEAGNMADAFDFLPAAYQADLDNLVHQFADRMDPEVWSRLFGTLRKCNQVLKTKKDFVLGLDLFRDHPDVDQYRKHWDGMVELLESFAESDASSLARLKQATVRSLLPGKASPAMRQFDALGMTLGANLARQFAGVTVTPVRSEGAEQVVAIQGPQDDKPVEFTYVQLEGRWLPKALTENWKEGLGANKVWVDKLPERVKAVKPQILDSLSQAEGILDQLLAASNREQFEQAAGPAILMLATAWPNAQLLAQQAVSGKSELPHVIISINRELTERELNGLVKAILKPLQESGSDYTLLANDGRTLCRILRISEVAPLRESLATHFSIPPDDVQFDQDTSTIKVDIAR
jgi:hypothetical protein